MTGSSIVELSRSLHAKRLSSVELTQAMLDRIASHNPLLNAFITVDSEGALAAAKEAEPLYKEALERYRRADRPRHGLGREP